MEPAKSVRTACRLTTGRETSRQAYAAYSFAHSKNSLSSFFFVLFSARLDNLRLRMGIGKTRARSADCLHLVRLHSKSADAFTFIAPNVFTFFEHHAPDRRVCHRQTCSHRNESCEMKSHRVFLDFFRVSQTPPDALISL